MTSAAGRSRGVRVGVDVGRVRVGVAASDPSGFLASPVTTLRRDVAGGTDRVALAALVAEREAVEVLVGLPRTLAGREGPSAEDARSYAAALAPLVAPVPVTMVDERLSTVVAEQLLAARGVRARAQRRVIDQEAAVVILQGALDADRVLAPSDDAGRPA